MCDPTGRAVAEISPPALAQGTAALAAFGSTRAHEAFTGSRPCLNSVELCPAGSKAARLNSEGLPIVVVAAHRESESSAEDRAVQTAAPFRNIKDEVGDLCCIIGRDLNNHQIPQRKPDGGWHLERAPKIELGLEFSAADGFGRLRADGGSCTTGRHPLAPRRPQRQVLDWLPAGELRADQPFIVPAVGGCGNGRQDHEIVGLHLVH